MDGMRMSEGTRTRLAPTPSGHLHAGNALDFLITSRLAQERGAKLLLRIDDLDSERVRPEYVEDIFRSLEWLGIRWDEGPSGPDELRSKWSQQLRASQYLALADQLRKKDVLYACSCSRTTPGALDTGSHYSGLCRNKGNELDDPHHAWRLNVQGIPMVKVPALLGADHEVDLAMALGDPVVRQRNGRAAYQLASLWDDLHFGVTFIVRGMDLLPSTACQLRCAELLGMDPIRSVRFIHHSLLIDRDGHKLSKSAGSSSLKAMREAGLDASQLQRQADRVLEFLQKRS